MPTNTTKKIGRFGEPVANPVKISPLGRKLAAIRKKIEIDPSTKLLTREEVRKEVESRRTGNDWKK